MALVQVSDVFVPGPFDEYASKADTFKLALIQSGIMVHDPRIDALLAQGGKTYTLPSWEDFSTTASQVATDDTTDATPMNVGNDQEIGTRLYRTASWKSSALAEVLSGDDPMGEMASKVGRYWAYQKQSWVLDTLKGVLADNTANDSGDYTNDISNSGSYVAGVTSFSAEAMLDTAQLMGDSQDELVAIICHSIVYNRMQKNNLIDTIPDSQGAPVKTFLGRVVLVDDRLPYSAGVAHTYLFGRGFLRYGEAQAPIPSEVYRQPTLGTGAGLETLVTRRIASIHPTGHSYAGTCPNGGPADGTGSNALGAAGSWNRVYSDTKKIKFRRLITTEV